MCTVTLKETKIFISKIRTELLFHECRLVIACAKNITTGGFNKTFNFSVTSGEVAKNVKPGLALFLILNSKY